MTVPGPQFGFAWRLAAFGDGGLGGKDEFVLFADDNGRDCGVEVELRRMPLRGGVVRKNDAGRMESEFVLRMLGSSSWSVTSNSPSGTASVR